MLPYAIGLDIGVASVGWAIVALDERDLPCGIIDMGSRVFPAAEDPQTGASLAAPRREARSARRRLRRHRHRNERIRALLVRAQVLTQSQLDSLFDGQLEDIYQLRVRALDEPVSSTDFARILIHLSQRRGFRSNRKNASSKEDGLLLSAVQENRARMEEKQYRTVGEMYLKDETFAQHKRNKGGAYLATVQRDMVAEEARLIFQAQRSFGMPFAGEALEEAYLDILTSQRSFDEGPGHPSRYGGSQIENMVGNCTLIPEEKRAAKASYSFETFSFLEKINHMRILSPEGSTPLTPQQRKDLTALALKKENVTYLDIRKLFGLCDAQTFNMVRYGAESAAETEKKTKLAQFKAYHQMRKAFEKAQKGRFAQLSDEQRDNIATAVSLYRTSERIRAKLAGQGFTDDDFTVIESLSFSGFGHISIRACRMLIPYFEQGMNYNEACGKAGLDFKAHAGQEKTRFLRADAEVFENITSPVVRRSMSQTIKVVNAIIRRMDQSPVFINIELAREMARDFSERKKAERDMESNRKQNERIMERIRTEFHRENPTGQDLVKLRLWQEQDGVCVYSQKPISIQRLFEPGYAEVDHIVPYSLSFDDTRKNKVLVLAEENRQKGNRLPLQYLTGKRREDYIVWVNSHIFNVQKRRQLLREDLTDEDLHRMRERSLTDTKTMSVFLYNLLRDHLAFAPFSTNRVEHVTPVNGRVTSMMRGRWGISKVRADGDLHHAVDALVVACTTRSMIQQVSRYAQFRECEYMQDGDQSHAVDTVTGEIIRTFPAPWHRFRDELTARLSDNPAAVLEELKLPMYLSGAIAIPDGPIFVSRMPNHKVTGPAHDATVRHPATLDGQSGMVTKTPLTELKLKDGEIENYFEPQSDRLLYEARLTEYGGDAKKAFAQEFHKPKSDGMPGPVVRKVKIWKPASSGVVVQNGTGVAQNGSMVRVDVFFVPNDGYYFVPVYVAQTLDKELPRFACVQNNPWKQMRDEDFLFSLYPGDLIRVTHKKELKLTKAYKESSLPDTLCIKQALLYFVSAGISIATFSCITHDHSYVIKSLGIKTLAGLEKMTVDVLGVVHHVGRETRLPFNFKKG